MKIFILMGFILNLILIITFVLNLLILKNNKINPKLRADIGTFLVFLFVLYLIYTGALILYGVIALGLIKYLIFLPFLIIPFYIGKIVKYKTLVFYSFVQLALFILNEIILFKM